MTEYARSLEWRTWSEASLERERAVSARGALRDINHGDTRYNSYCRDMRLGTFLSD